MHNRHGESKRQFKEEFKETSKFDNSMHIRMARSCSPTSTRHSKSLPTECKKIDHGKLKPFLQIIEGALADNDIDLSYLLYLCKHRVYSLALKEYYIHHLSQIPLEKLSPVHHIVLGCFFFLRYPIEYTFEQKESKDIQLTHNAQALEYFRLAEKRKHPLALLFINRLLDTGVQPDIGLDTKTKYPLSYAFSLAWDALDSEERPLSAQSSSVLIGGYESSAYREVMQKKYLQDAADSNHAIAQYLLGNLFIKDWFKSPTAVSLYKMASGNHLGLATLALANLEKRPVQKAELLHQALENFKIIDYTNSAKTAREKLYSLFKTHLSIPAIVNIAIDALHEFYPDLGEIYYAQAKFEIRKALPESWPILISEICSSFFAKKPSSTETLQSIAGQLITEINKIPPETRTDDIQKFFERVVFLEEKAIREKNDHQELMQELLDPQFAESRSVDLRNLIERVLSQRPIRDKENKIALRS